MLYIYYYITTYILYLYYLIKYYQHNMASSHVLFKQNVIIRGTAHMSINKITSSAKFSRFLTHHNLLKNPISICSFRTFKSLCYIIAIFCAIFQRSMPIIGTHTFEAYLIGTKAQ